MCIPQLASPDRLVGNLSKKGFILSTCLSNVAGVVTISKPSLIDPSRLKIACLPNSLAVSSRPCSMLLTSYSSSIPKYKGLEYKDLLYLPSL